MKAIGKVSASEKYPTTVDDFYFWLEDNIIVRPFDIVKVNHYKNTITYGVIEEITHITDSSGHIGSFVSSDFGDVSSEPETLRLGLTFVKCKVLSNTSSDGKEQIYMPILDGKKVFLCNEEEISEALGLKDIQNPIPAGFIEMSNNINVPIHFNCDFVIGTEGAHLNISGISGLATKTSYAMFLLQALQQKKNDLAIIILNVKGSDLLRLDEPNPSLTKTQKDDYKRCGLECKPFENVKYYYPFIRRKEKYYCNTYLQPEVIETQCHKDQANTFIYTYEDNKDQLDLLFSNIDDPAQTIESILSFIAESPDFDGLTWDSFQDVLKEYTEKGHSKNKEISIQSWRKFKRLIRKSVNNHIFQESLGKPEYRQVNLQEQIKNIQKGESLVIDIARLDEQLQCFVFGDIVRAAYELKLGEVDNRKEKDIPNRIIIFVDELNKYASSSAPRNSPILNNILEISERGRSMGIILFSAEQFKSAIHDRAKGNCSTHAYGRTNAIEISKPDYRFIPKVFTNMMTRLSKGDLIIEHPIFRSLLKIKFPFPAYHQNEDN
jgi:DNA helicase HerA-like ATPase